MWNPDETQKRLIEAAGVVFAEKGYEGATVREIVERAEANVASVNYHFGGKERLYIEAVKRASEIIYEAVPLPHWPLGVPAETRLRDFIRMFLNRVVVDRQPEWAGKLIMLEVFKPTAACAAFVEGFVRPTFQMLAGILAELLPPETPEVQRRLAGFSIVGQCLHYRMARPVITLLIGPEQFGRLDVDLLTEHITNFSLAALRAESSSPQPVLSGPAGGGTPS